MKEHSMRHIPSTASCRGLVGLVFGHRYEPVPEMSVAVGDTGSATRASAVGIACRRCGAVTLFYEFDDDDDDDGEVPFDPPMDADDEPEPGMPVVDGDFLRTVV